IPRRARTETGVPPFAAGRKVQVARAPAHCFPINSLGACRTLAFSNFPSREMMPVITVIAFVGGESSFSGSDLFRAYGGSSMAGGACWIAPSEPRLTSAVRGPELVSAYCRTHACEVGAISETSTYTV